MASYLDEIPKFREYVPYLDPKAVAQVGMYKQEKYEQNVTKIQDEMEKIAGLDVNRPQDKAYLQSKLDELGGNLRMFAAGDFSNFQLANSVSGMTKQIVKDPTVQGAVASTAMYRKQKQAIEDARKNGKSNIANEDLFSSQASKWYNDPTPGAAFTDEFIPYTDVFKKLQEIAKSVGEDSTIVQQLFRTDSNGNPVLVDGKLQYNDVMAEKLLKGKDKDKILNAFQTGLDANDYRQLNISGRYQLKDKSLKNISQILENGFSEYQKSQLLRKDAIQDKILELKTKGGSKEEIDAFEKDIINIDNNISKRRSNIDDMLKSSDLDAIKGSVYTNNYLDSMSGAFSSKDTYTKYLKHPGVEAMMDRERLKLSTNEYLLNRDKFRYEQIHDASTDAFNRWKALFEKGLVDEKGRPTGAGLYSGAARDLGIPDQTNPLYFSDQFEQGLRDDTNAQFGLYEKVAIADWMAKNSGKINPETGKAFTANEMKADISRWASKVGMSYNDYIVLQGQKATDRYNQTKGKSLGAEYADDFKVINELGTRIGINKKKMEGEEDFIKANASGFTPFDFKKVNVQPMDIEMNIPTTYEGGKASGYVKQKLHLTKEDLYNFALISSEISGTSIEQPFTSGVAKENAKAARQYLLRKFGSDAAIDAIGRRVNIPSGFSSIIPKKESPNPFVKLVSDDNFNKTMVLREQYYKGISEVGVPKGVVLYKDKSEQKEHLQSALASVASDYAGIDNSYQDIAKAATDDKSQFQINIDPAASRYGNNSYNIQVTKADGSIITKSITEKQYEFLTGKEAPSLFVNDILSSIKASNYGSTNLAYMYTDDNAYSTAFVKDDQTRTKNYNVAMDFAYGSGGLLFPKIYVQVADDDWKLIPYNAGLSPEQAKNFPSSVDDVFIKSLLQSK